MANRLRIHPAIEADLRRAIEWYDKASLERGAKFRQAVKQRFTEIQKAPYSFAISDDARFAQVKGFPYLIIFQPLNDGPFIIGVVHASSDPSIWRDRIQTP